MCFSNIKKLVVNQELLDIESQIFIENDVIIIKSGTGSGKTKIVAKVANDLIKSNPDHRILSLVNLIVLYIFLNLFLIVLYQNKFERIYNVDIVYINGMFGLQYMCCL